MKNYEPDVFRLIERGIFCRIPIVRMAFPGVRIDLFTVEDRRPLSVSVRDESEKVSGIKELKQHVFERGYLRFGS